MVGSISTCNLIYVPLVNRDENCSVLKNKSALKVHLMEIMARALLWNELCDAESVPVR